MKLGFLDRAYSNQMKTVESEYNALFWRKNHTLGLSSIKSMLARAIAFAQLIIRILLNGYRPKIRQGRDRDNNVYWYAYYPLSGVSKVIAFDAEIKQWLELTQEI